ncbi:MAG: UDP-N-acetylmuramoyl-L-alanine--D-glutamate ligase [Pseudonocardiales bacterium]|nr:MAG: UDP-N-acetylmuramoyl-L-alanine--D-glutamate ligase [Pseudonocardiales bacterium]
MTVSYSDRSVLVAGAGVAGAAVAEVLLRLGARVTVTDRALSARTEALSALGAKVTVGLAALPAGIDQVVTSPGWRPDNPLLRDAAARGVEVIGEIELAWRLRSSPVSGRPAAPWLAITGTNGKTTTVEMLAGMLRAAGLRAVAAGNVGRPLVGAVVGLEPYDVLAVELSSFQLYWTSTVAPAAATILNLAPDHLDWHGSLAAYAAAKAKIWAPGTFAVRNADDAWSVRLSGDLPGAAYTLGEPADGQLGVVDGTLVDRAFGHGAFATVAGLPVTGPHNVANALAAAALAFAYDVPPSAVSAGLAGFEAGPHRNTRIGAVDGITYVDDSKATNPHAAAASLVAYDRVVWVAGGLLKGADVDDLVAEVAGRLAGVVLMGADRAVIARALARHAPDVPVVEVGRTDDGAMADVVAVASRLARPGDVVLLAPAAASMDMFSDYAARGAAFVQAVRALGEA